MEILDWSLRSDLCNTRLLEQELNAMNQDAHVRIDMRSMHLPLAALDVLVVFLRRVPTASACVGNNLFSFDAFCSKLDEIGAMDLFNMDRITTGWTAQEVAVSHMASHARADGRILQLTEAIEKMRTAHENDYAKHEKDSKAAEAKHDRIRDRVLGLEGYNTNAALCIEYAVTDVVDNLMQDELGFILEEREHRVKLYDQHGVNVGEIDGLMRYKVLQEGEERMVAVAVEAKSNMTEFEFSKVHVNVKHLKSAIAAGLTATGDLKYQRLCRSLSVLQGVDLFVAVGAPVIPDHIAAAARDLKYLVVQGIREGQYEADTRSVTIWKQLNTVPGS